MSRKMSISRRNNKTNFETSDDIFEKALPKRGKEEDKLITMSNRVERRSIYLLKEQPMFAPSMTTNNMRFSVNLAMEKSNLTYDDT